MAGATKRAFNASRTGAESTLLSEYIINGAAGITLQISLYSVQRLKC